MEASILAGPSSRRTSSALRRRLGGRPIGRSRASRADGRFSFCRALTQTSDYVWLGEDQLAHLRGPAALGRHL